MKNTETEIVNKDDSSMNTAKIVKGRACGGQLRWDYSPWSEGLHCWIERPILRFATRKEAVAAAELQGHKIK